MYISPQSPAECHKELFSSQIYAIYLEFRRNGAAFLSI